MAESMLIFAPNANSYRRFRRNSYAPVSASWGINNRTVSLRIPAGQPEYLPHRAPPRRRRCQPLSCAGGGSRRHALRHHRRLDPGPPVTGNGYERLAEHIPSNWYEAIDALRASRVLKEYFGEGIRRLLLHLEGSRGRPFLCRADRARLRLVSPHGLIRPRLRRLASPAHHDAVEDAKEHGGEDESHVHEGEPHQPPLPVCLTSAKIS